MCIEFGPKDISRRTFGGFLKADNSRVLIPLFQRRYCWNRKLAAGWFSDTVNGKRDHLGGRSVLL